MLLGREKERQTLETLLRDAREGKSGVLGLVGEPGIGKSAMLDCAASLATGMRILRARGVPSETNIPFAGLFELLRPALDGLDRLPEPQAAALESALALRPAKVASRFAIGAATLSLLAAHADAQAVCVLIDDVHWLDGSSADALGFALRRLLAEPIAVVLAAREGEPSLLDSADLRLHRLQGLDAAATEALLRRATPEATAETAYRLHRETGGNPLALLELADRNPSEVALELPVPVVTSVAQVYVERAATLPDRTRDALVLAAATDRGELGLFSRAAAALELDLSDLTPAETIGLVSLHAGRVEFRHPLARSALYGAATAARRRDVHRSLSRALPDADADRRAWHLALAATGLDEVASTALEQAAERANGRGAHGVASGAFQQAATLAVSHDRRERLLVSAAEAAWLGGLADRAGDLIEEARALADDKPLPVAAEHLRGHIALRRGPLDEAQTILLAASERAEPAAAAVMIAEAVEGAYHAADVAVARECAERARALATSDLGETAAFFNAATRGMALILSGDGHGGAAALRGAAKALGRSAEIRSDPRLLAWAALGPLWLREADTDLDLVDRAESLARSRAAVGVLPHLLTHVAIKHASTDRWAEAEAGFDEAIRLARETGQRVILAWALSRRACIDARLGHEHECRARAAEALEISRRHGVHMVEIWALTALGDLELALGNVDAALGLAAERLALLERREIADVDLYPGPEQVELYLRLGRDDEARRTAASYERAAVAKGQPWALARATRARAMLTDDGYDAVIAEALALLERTPDVFEAARTRLAHGARLRRDGRRTDAREQLRRAIDAFDALGARPWAETARAELSATGETARRRTPSSLDELTPQELQISLLLAEGRTTREAAAALFLSPKTIEYHLRNAYRKLDIHSRDELARALDSRNRP